MRAFPIMIAATTLVIASASYAEELRPIQANSIHLGEVTGTAYYTVESDRFQVVATMAAGDATMPIRFVTSLNLGQSVTISVPGAVGKPPAEINLTRTGDRIFVGNVLKVARVN